MSLQMLLQSYHVCEDLSTDTTCTFLLLRVRPQMTSVISLKAELFPTLLTFPWGLTGMDSNMVSQDGALTKPFSADMTFKWLLP